VLVVVVLILVPSQSLCQNGLRQLSDRCERLPPIHYHSGCWAPLPQFIFRISSFAYVAKKLKRNYWQEIMYVFTQHNFLASLSPHLLILQCRCCILYSLHSFIILTRACWWVYVVQWQLFTWCMLTRDVYVGSSMDMLLFVHLFISIRHRSCCFISLALAQVLCTWISDWRIVHLLWYICSLLQLWLCEIVQAVWASLMLKLIAQIDVNRLRLRQKIALSILTGQDRMCVQCVTNGLQRSNIWINTKKHTI